MRLGYCAGFAAGMELCALAETTMFQIISDGADVKASRLAELCLLIGNTCLFE